MPISPTTIMISTRVKPSRRRRNMTLSIVVREGERAGPSRHPALLRTQDLEHALTVDGPAGAYRVEQVIRVGPRIIGTRRRAGPERGRNAGRRASNRRV